MLAALPRVVSERLTVDQITDVEAFEALREEWDELLAASDSSCVFLTWEWLYTWWKHLRENRKLCILAVRRGSELVALAPLAQRPRRLTCPFSVLEFLGSGFVGSDYLDFIVRKGAEDQASQALISHLAKERVPLKLTNLNRGQNIAADVLAGLPGWTTTEARTNICPFISLDGATWASYLTSLSAAHRYNFNRKWRSLNRDYDVRFQQVRTEAECRAAIDGLIGQHNTRWRARGGSTAFHTTELVAFHREWGAIALERGWLRFYVLRLNEQPAACLYGFRFGGTFYFYQSSFDAAFTQSSVGLITMGLAIQCAIGEGAAEFDLLHGSEAYKSHWSRESRDLGRLESFPPGGAGSLYRLSLELGRFVRRMTKKDQAQ
jgi:CelD/BcsL family acetyltransferase involved in cellulose biosynthesis